MKRYLLLGLALFPMLTWADDLTTQMNNVGQTVNQTMNCQLGCMNGMQQCDENCEACKKNCVDDARKVLNTTVKPLPTQSPTSP